MCLPFHPAPHGRAAAVGRAAARGRLLVFTSWQTPNYQLTADDGLDSKSERNPQVKTRTGKALGATAAVAAIAMSLPLAITAYADPPPEPTPVAEIPDPQGPGCDAFKQALPTFKNLAKEPVGTTLASIPDLGTFNSAISGQLNPAVNIVPRPRQRPVRGVRADQ